jgi:hypothetical protein
MPGEWSPDETRVLMRLRPEFEPLGVKYLARVGSPDPIIHVPATLLPDVRGRIAAERTGDTGRPPVERAVSHKAGAPERRYPRGEIARVLLARRERRVSQEDLARAGFSRTAVRRVIRLDRHGGFRLGPRGGFGSNGEFRPAGREVSLRALERALGLGPLGGS